MQEVSDDEVTGKKKERKSQNEGHRWSTGQKELMEAEGKGLRMNANEGRVVRGELD